MAISDKLAGTRSTTSTGGQSKVGGAVGKVMNALTGENRTHRIDRDREDAYWRENYLNEPYISKGRNFDEYSHAYRTGYEGFCKCQPGARFEDMESTLQQDYTARNPSLPWSEARPAALAAWNRVSGGESFTVPLSEEELSVHKREVEAGSAQLRKVVKTETVNQPVELRREEAVIERVAPTSQQVPANAFTEETINIPLKREEAVVEKTAHVTGEVQVKKGQQVETQNVQEQVRKEDVIIEKEGNVKINREGKLNK